MNSHKNARLTFEGRKLLIERIAGMGLMPAAEAAGGTSSIQRVLFSNEFGLVVLIALAFAVFASVLPGFTTPFSLFAIGRQIGRDRASPAKLI